MPSTCVVKLDLVPSVNLLSGRNGIFVLYVLCRRKCRRKCRRTWTWITNYNRRHHHHSEREPNQVMSASTCETHCGLLLAVHSLMSRVRKVMEKRKEKGPICPQHLREAYRQLQQSSQLPLIRTTTTSLRRWHVWVTLYTNKNLFFLNEGRLYRCARMLIIIITFSHYVKTKGSEERTQDLNTQVKEK